MRRREKNGYYKKAINKIMSTQSDLMNIYDNDAYLNDTQLLRLYQLFDKRKFLHNYIEKRIIQNLEPININPSSIINLGCDLTTDIHNIYKLFLF